MRVLCYLNISASKNILSDSGLIQTAGMIEYILNHNKDYHFYLWLPNFINMNQLTRFKEKYPIFESENVTFIYVPITKVRRMSPYDFHFKRMEKCADYRHKDYDIVYNGLPEYTENLSQLMCRNVNLDWGVFNIPIINRLHWIMSGEHVAIPDDRIELKQCVGFVLANENLTLCDYTMEMVNSMQNKWFPHKELNVRSIYNGIETKKIQAEEKNSLKKGDKIRLLYPNRLQSFKNPIFMLESLIKLREKRQDFELILTDPTADYTHNNKLKSRKLVRIIQENSDWIKVQPVNGKEYYRMIHSSDVVINTSDYETWCLVITEALACGKNVVVPNGLTFEEMISPDYPFIYEKRRKKSFLEKLELAIEKAGTMVEENKKYADKYDWKNVGQDYLDLFEEYRKKYILEPDYSTKDRDRLLDKVRQEGKMRKSEIIKFLGPGSEKNWSKYRWHLLKNGVKDLWESEESVYYVGDKPHLDKQQTLF